MIQPFWRYISKSYSLCPSLLIPVYTGNVKVTRKTIKEMLEAFTFFIISDGFGKLKDAMRPFFIYNKDNKWMNTNRSFGWIIDTSILSLDGVQQCFCVGVVLQVFVYSMSSTVFF